MWSSVAVGIAASAKRPAAELPLNLRVEFYYRRARDLGGDFAASSPSRRQATGRAADDVITQS